MSAETDRAPTPGVCHRMVPSNRNGIFFSADSFESQTFEQCKLLFIVKPEQETFFWSSFELCGIGFETKPFGLRGCHCTQQIICLFQDFGTCVCVCVCALVRKFLQPFTVVPSTLHFSSVAALVFYCQRYHSWCE